MDDLPGKKPSDNQGMSFDILTVLGHDLKSPVNAVESYLDILRNRVLGDELDPYMTILENAVARLHLMRELVTDVVDWARLQQPDASRALTPLDVSGTVRAALDGYAKEAQARNIAVTADIEDGLSMTAAAREIDLLLRNLISNAIKYNKDNGSVHVSLKRDGPHIALNVTDTGIGLSREEQARRFEEFVRIRNSRTQDIRGTGLGLAIVKKLVELYRGAVSVQSEPDAGSTFSLMLSPGE
jgi:signal transduction histidine kinase